MDSAESVADGARVCLHTCRAADVKYLASGSRAAAGCCQAAAREGLGDLTAIANAALSAHSQLQLRALLLCNTAAERGRGSLAPSRVIL